MGLFDGMYPVLISTASGKKYPDTRQGREQLDRDEGRVRAPGCVMEAVVTLHAAVTVAENALDSIQPFIRKHVCGRMLKAQVAGLRKSLSEITAKISYGQNRTLQANTQLTSITVTSKPVPGFVNLDLEDLECLTRRSLEACSMFCRCTREESKYCRLREAYEHVTSAHVTENGSENLCPYAGLTVEEDDRG